MRRVLGVVLIGIGVFGLVLAGVVRFWAYPSSEKTPLNLNVTLNATGPAKVFDAATGQLEAVQLAAYRVVQVDSAHSDGTNVVMRESLCIVIQQNNPPHCPKDARLLPGSPSTDQVATNRKSAEAVNDAKYGGNVNGNTSVQHTGLSYKWPFNAKKTTYQFFNPDVNQAFPATYEGTDKVDGVTAYKYVSVTPKMDADVFPGVPGYYTDTRTVWVEPKTGRIIKGEEHQIRQFRGGASDGQTAVDADLTFDAPTVAAQAKAAKSDDNKLELASLWLPLGGLVIGLIAIAGGIAVLLSGRRAQPAAGYGSPEPQFSGEPGPAVYGPPPGSAGFPPPEPPNLPPPDLPPPGPNGPPPDTEVTRPLPR